jgi:hypothetical protein
VIGDVHGCIDELEALLTKAGHRAGDDVVFVGDLVAKGPDSPSVVGLARALGARCVRGNHDEEVLRCVRALRAGEEPERAKKTHRLVAEALSPEDAAYLEATPFFLDLAPFGVWVVHAGVRAGVSLSEQHPNELMTMRSIRSDGTISARLSEGELWAARYPGPAHVLFGHDAITGLQRHAHATGLDTGCVYGHQLTALILPERRLVQVDAKRAYSGIEA